MSPVVNSIDSDIVYDQISPSCFEFKLNRNKSHNSITSAMNIMITAKLHTWAMGKEKAPKVVMISGTGDKAFSAGGDIKEVCQMIKDKETEDFDKMHYQGFAMNYFLATMKPI